eukprot:g4556.t1
MKQQNVHFERGPIGWLQRYALLSYNRPIALFFGIALGIIIIGGLGGIFGFSLSNTDHEWEIKTNRHVKQNAAIDEALDSISEETDQQKYSVSSDDLETYITYRVKRGERPYNIFTAENLETIRRFENFIMGFDNYTDVCIRNYTEGSTVEGEFCDRPLSVLINFFEYNVQEAQFGDWLDEDLPNVEDRIRQGIQRILDHPFENAFYLDNRFSADNRVTEYTRSRIQFGLPIDFPRFEEGRRLIARGENADIYNNSKTDEEDQVDELFDEFWSDLEEELWDYLDMNAPTPLQTEYSDIGERDNLEIIFYNLELNDREFQRIVLSDFMWAGLSILSVWIYMLVHLGSVFLSLVGIFEIFMSFPVALFFYTPIFQIDHFSELNLLVIFILLGIGADDIFVFTDAYKQSGSVPGVDPSLQGRLMYSAARASKAVFVTSFTTMAAFFATAATPLMPMQAFGIFAALCIIFLFLINLLMMPPTLVLYAGYTPILSRTLCPCCVPENRPEWVTKYCPCCTCCHVEIDDTFYLPLAPPSNEHKPSPGAEVEVHPPEQVNTAELEMTPGTVVSSTGQSTAPLPGEGQSSSQHPPNGPPIEFKRQHSLADAELENLRSMEKFFYGPFFLFINSAKYVILTIALVLFIVGMVYVSTFKTPDEAEQWFPSEHAFDRFQGYFDRTSTPYQDSAEDSVAEVYLVWGLEGMDTSGRNIWDGDDFGELEYDTTFDPTPERNQLFLLDVCRQVRIARCEAAACSEPWLIRLNREGISDDDDGTALADQQRCWIEDFNEWLQTNQSQSIPVPHDTFIPLLRNYLTDPARNVEFGEDIGYSEEDETLRFVIFRFDSTYRPPQSDSKTKNVIDEWEDFIDRLNEDATRQDLQGVNKAFQSGRDPWVWPSTSDALVSGAISGVILVFVLAFVVLNIASGNLIISIIAVMTIAGIVSVVMGIGVRAIMDWDLGTAESITVVIVIGFSMDYTLHLSDAYMESPHSSRYDRTRDALTHLGISVTAGAFTTLISALFLWATVLVFFQKFAFNVTSTVFTSYLFSILVFPSLCLAFGPQGDFGSWPRMINGAARRCGFKPPCGEGEESHH